MKRMATAVALVILLAAPAAMAQDWYGWTVSNSTTDPLSNTGPIAPGSSMFAGNLYLWLHCNGSGTTGVAAVEVDVVELTGTPGAGVTGFNGLNGVLNAGSATALLLAVGGCPGGPLLAGSFSVGPDAFIADIELCLVPSAANDRSITVQCGGLGIPNAEIGFKKTGTPSCIDLDPVTCTGTTAVESSTWGQIKGLYR